MENDSEKKGPRIPKGRYRGKATSWMMANSPEKKTPYMFVEFELTDESFRGERLSWNGWLTDSAADRTMEALRYCGWNNDDIYEATGIGDNEVELVVDHETFEGKTFARVAFVNRIGGFQPKAPMSPEEGRAFAAKMRGKAAASRVKTGNNAAPPTDVPVTGPDGKPLPF